MKIPGLWIGANKMMRFSVVGSLVAGLLFFTGCAFPLAGLPSPTITPLLEMTLAAATHVPASPIPTEPVSIPVQGAAASLTPVPTALPTATPAPILRQLTSGGCCAQPFWSPDSQQVLFLDKPAAEAPVGFWSVNLAGDAPQLFTDRLGVYSRDLNLRAFPANGLTVVERMADGMRWNIANGGRSVSFSPDGQLLAWVGGASGPPFDTAQRQIWVSQVDGRQARLVATLLGGGLSGWFPDGRLLVNGRLEASEEDQVLWALSLTPGADGKSQMTELGRGQRLRNVSLSPDGTWLAYVVTFSADPAQDGLWLTNTQTLAKQRLGLFGAFRWRDGQRLLVAPLDFSQPVHRLWQVQADTGQAEPLTDPAVTPLRIANGDWSVSPDGRWVIFVSALDYNIWLLALP